MRVRKYYEKGTGEEREEMLLSRAEQRAEYDRILAMILDPNRTRQVLDNLEGMPEFKVAWKNYGRPELLRGGRRN
jgi:hypothetical protein